MIASPAPSVEIDSVHCAAICKEAGHRLELYLKEVPKAPPELERLLTRLQQLDRQDEEPIAGSPTAAEK
jgi:hypothetical protein